MRDHTRTNRAEAAAMAEATAMLPSIERDNICHTLPFTVRSPRCIADDTCLINVYSSTSLLVGYVRATIDAAGDVVSARFSPVV